MSERGRGSLVHGYQPRIRELLAAFPQMLAKVIAERVAGRTRSAPRLIVRQSSGRVSRSVAR
jgi:hypothetical protein